MAIKTSSKTSNDPAQTRIGRQHFAKNEPKIIPNKRTCRYSCCHEPKMEESISREKRENKKCLISADHHAEKCKEVSERFSK